jgi:hypothetical protein
VAGCVHQPQSPGEFRQAINDGHGRKDSYNVDRPFDEVLRTFKEKAEPGFTQRHESTLMTGLQVEHSVVIFRCTVSSQDGRAELVIQKENRPKGVGPKMPEGGWFWLVADLESVSPRETRLTTYGLSGIAAGKTGNALEAIRQWAQGKDLPPPPLR